MLCSHTRFTPEPHSRANPQSHRDPQPRLNQPRFAGLYLIDVSSASSALSGSSRHAIRARSRQGIAHSDRVSIAA